MQSFRGLLILLAIAATSLKEIIVEAHNYEYDLVVIGGGSAGLAAVREARKYGKKVALYDYVTPTPRGTTWGLGGTCVNVGCIPKKLMHQATLVAEAVKGASMYGWTGLETVKSTIDWEQLTVAVNNHIQSINWVSYFAVRESNVTFIQAQAYFKDPHTVAGIKNTKEVVTTANNVLIAVGGRPKYLNIPGGMQYAITSDDLFRLSTPPGNTLIIGAGYVGLECAGLLNGLGYNVTLMNRSPTIEGFELAGFVVDELKDRGVNFLYSSNAKTLGKSNEDDKNILVHWTDSANRLREDTYNTVLFAVGRQAATNDLRLHMAGVAVNAKSKGIETTYEQTNVPHIYAAGDVLHAKPQFTPVAIHAAQRLIHRLFGRSVQLMDYENVAATLFTPLEYGWVGIGEKEANKSYGATNYDIYHTYYKPTEFTIPEKSIANCYLKVLALNYGDKRVLGFHYVGPNAGEVIQGFSAAMQAGLSFPKLQATIGIHPTTAEEFTRVWVSVRSGLDPKPQNCCN